VIWDLTEFFQPVDGPPVVRYTFVWRTSSAWAETCRRLVLVFELDDGTTHTANFRFTR
jgi:hypothetical protein